MNRKDLIARYIWLDQVAKAAGDAKRVLAAELNADARAEYEEQQTASTWRIPGMATVPQSVTNDAVVVKDEPKFVDWVARRFPTEVAGSPSSGRARRTARSPRARRAPPPAIHRALEVPAFPRARPRRPVSPRSGKPAGSWAWTSTAVCAGSCGLQWMPWKPNYANGQSARRRKPMSGC